VNKYKIGDIVEAKIRFKVQGSYNENGVCFYDLTDNENSDGSSAYVAEFALEHAIKPEDITDEK